MDANSTVSLLARLQELAREGDLSDRKDLLPEVMELRGYAEYQCKMDRNEYNHAFAAAAQAYFLVSGTGLPAFEETTYQRVIEHSELAIDAISNATADTTRRSAHH